MGARGRLLLAAPAVAAVIAGCGGGETRTVTVTEESRTPAGGTSDATTAPAGEERAPAEGTGAVAGRPFSFRIVELRRSGATVVLNATLTLDEGAEGRVRVGDLFGDGIEQPLTTRRTRSEPADVFDGVALVDPDNRRQYLVARDADGRCVCSRGLARVRAAPGVPVSLTATLGAPPGGVARVDVVVPNVRTFTGVALAE
jgi:hypothetical protein